MNTTRRTASAVIVCGTLALTAGCGGGSTVKHAAAAASASAPTSASASAPVKAGSGDAILAEAIADTKAASSVHVTGTGSAGETLDLLIASGKGCHASVTTGDSTAGLVRIGSRDWMLINADNVQTVSGTSIPEARAALGKYAQVDGGDPAISKLAPRCDLSAQLDAAITDTTGLSVGPATTVDGVKAVTLTSGTGETALVSAGADPLVLRVTAPGSGGGTVNFGDYGKAAAITAPTAAQTVSASDQ